MTYSYMYKIDLALKIMNGWYVIKPKNLISPNLALIVYLCVYNIHIVLKRTSKATIAENDITTI